MLYVFSYSTVDASAVLYEKYSTGGVFDPPTQNIINRNIVLLSATSYPLGVRAQLMFVPSNLFEPLKINVLQLFTKHVFSIRSTVVLRKPFDLTNLISTFTHYGIPGYTCKVIHPNLRPLLHFGVNVSNSLEGTSEEPPSSNMLT